MLLSTPTQKFTRFSHFLTRVSRVSPLWGRVLRINLTAPFLLTQACLPLLRKASDASVVFVSDTVGRRGKAYWGAYGASKFGLEGLMQILAEELSAEGRIRIRPSSPNLDAP